MKRRRKTNLEIFRENGVYEPWTGNVVSEGVTKAKIKSALDMISNAISATLGPYGSTTIIQNREINRHFATKDGLDLMNRINFNDDVARTVLDLVRNIALTQVHTVGDGSTSSIVIGSSLYKEIDKSEILKKTSPRDILDILKVLSEIIEREIEEIAVPVGEDLEGVAQIASISLNNDDAAGNLVRDIYKQVTSNGFITLNVTDNNTNKDYYEIKKGVSWDYGMIDPVFDKKRQGKVVFDKEPAIFISNSTLTRKDLTALANLVGEFALSRLKQLVIVTNDVDMEVLDFFQNNVKANNSLQVVVVGIETVTAKSREKIDDLALLAGCTVYDKNIFTEEELLVNPEKFVGQIAKIEVTNRRTEIVSLDSPDTEERINPLIEQLEEKIHALASNKQRDEKDELKIADLRIRLNSLRGSNAVLYISGQTVQEKISRERLFEDATLASRSAMIHGIIPGGNLTIPYLLRKEKDRLLKELKEKYTLNIKDRDIIIEEIYQVFYDTFLESYRLVLRNAYIDEERSEEIIEKCLTEGKIFNLRTHQYEDMNETKVVNSAETDIQIMKSTVSLIGLLATSNQMITIGSSMADLIDPEKANK